MNDSLKSLNIKHPGMKNGFKGPFGSEVSNFNIVEESSMQQAKNLSPGTGGVSSSENHVLSNLITALLPLRPKNLRKSNVADEELWVAF